MSFGSYATPQRNQEGWLARFYQFTVSRGVTTEIQDAEVERIRQICFRRGLFERLFPNRP